MSRIINAFNLTSSPIEKTTVLDPKLSGRKSYYNKAHVLHLTSGANLLKSYDTIVAFTVPTDDGNVGYITRKYSATTSIHQRDFLYQYTGQDVPANQLSDHEASVDDPELDLNTGVSYQTN